MDLVVVQWCVFTSPLGLNHATGVSAHLKSPNQMKICYLSLCAQRHVPSPLSPHSCHCYFLHFLEGRGSFRGSPARSPGAPQGLGSTGTAAAAAAVVMGVCVLGGRGGGFCLHGPAPRETVCGNLLAHLSPLPLSCCSNN